MDGNVNVLATLSSCLPKGTCRHVEPSSRALGIATAMKGVNVYIFCSHLLRVRVKGSKTTTTPYLTRAFL